MKDEYATLDDVPDGSDLSSTSPFSLPGFFSLLSDETLVAGLCETCGSRLLPPRPYCYECGSGEVVVEIQPLTGTIFSYTEVIRPPTGFSSATPYTIAIVELDSGARLTGRVNAPYEDVRISQPVRVTVEEAPINHDAGLPHEKDWPIPVFEPR